jgi:Na+/proline symporter
MPAETPTVPSVDAAAVAAFVGYLLVVVAIGVWAARRSSRGVGEFFLAGRGLGRFVVALSAVSSGRSSWLLLAFSGVAFQRGAIASVTQKIAITTATIAVRHASGSKPAGAFMIITKKAMGPSASPTRCRVPKVVFSPPSVSCDKVTWRPG